MRLFTSFVLYLGAILSLQAQTILELSSFPVPSAISGKVDQVSELKPYQEYIDSLQFSYMAKVILSLSAEKDQGKLEDYEVMEAIGQQNAHVLIQASSLLQLEHFTSKESVAIINESRNYDAIAFKIIENYMSGDKDKLVTLAYALTKLENLVPEGFSDNSYDDPDFAGGFKDVLGESYSNQSAQFGLAREFVSRYIINGKNDWVNSRMAQIAIDISGAIKPDFPVQIKGYIDTEVEAKLAIDYLLGSYDYYRVVGKYLSVEEAFSTQVAFMCEFLPLLDIGYFTTDGFDVYKSYSSEEKMEEEARIFLNVYKAEKPKTYVLNIRVIAAYTPIGAIFIKTGEAFSDSQELREALSKTIQGTSCQSHYEHLSNFAIIAASDLRTSSNN
jgi:hypothetical protein